MSNYRGLPATTCPHCEEVVLRGASRCKNCFEPVRVEGPGNIWGFLLLDAALILILVVGLNAAYRGYPQMNVIVDEESATIVVIKKFDEERYEADRIPFKDIVRIESLAEQSMLKGRWWQVSVIDTNQERHEINFSRSSSLDGYAQQIADLISIPLETIDNQTHSKLLGPVKATK